MHRGAAGGAGALIRRRLVCRGVVQGVGFRPAVWRLATALELDGFVRNDALGATIEVEGPRERVERFQQRLPRELPPRARLAALEVGECSPERAAHGFRVAESPREVRRDALTPPDAALCPLCRAEIEDPRDRRFRHPFATCTDCGPRHSIVRALPYDRERTSMAGFPLCPSCEREYRDPRSRRFHAETICCPACGPELDLVDAEGISLGRRAAALAAARALLASGGVLALQGLGGFQLACRADRDASVERLREAKQRATKPFALMVPDLDTARALLVLRAEDEQLLASARGPILLAPRRAGARLAPSVAPCTPELGLMLPTTPLHVELFRGLEPRVLVMTSGNQSDEPIAIEPGEARGRLHGMADAFLVHGRAIVRRIDDSVVRALDTGHVLVRRSRGWVPETLELPHTSREPLLALGGHLQNTVCAVEGARACPSQHVGDLDTDAARAFLGEVAQGLEEFLGTRARVFVADMHPDYPSGAAAEELARAREGRVLRVQHHLAHAAAVLAENGAFPRRGARAAALILDGTGFGTDGTAWGCEWLALDGELHWSRLAHGAEFALMGGERAVREPWRVALAALVAHGLDAELERLPLAKLVEPALLGRARGACRSPHWPRAAGAGRFFEAAGALLGLCATNGHEGEAAMRLESLAAEACDVAPWEECAALAGRSALAQDELLVAAARRLLAGEAPALIARGLHASFAFLALALGARILPRETRRVACGGGCLVNRLLVRDLARECTARGLEPLFARELPPGDGGLSFGQAVLGSATLALGREPRETTNLE